MINENFLKKETIEVLFSPQKLNNGQLIHYGIGWELPDNNKLKYIIPL